MHTFKSKRELCLKFIGHNCAHNVLDSSLFIFLSRRCVHVSHSRRKLSSSHLMAAAFVNLLCFQTPYRNKTTRIEKNVSFVIWLLEQTISLSQNHVNYIETCSDAIMNTVLFSVSFASANHLLTNFCRPSCRHLRARKD